MSEQRQSSIRNNLTRMLLLGAGLFIVVIALGLDLFMTRTLASRFDDDLFSHAQTLISLTVDDRDDREIELEFPNEFMPEFSEARGGAFFAMFLPDGEILAQSDSLKGREHGWVFRFMHRPVYSNIELVDVGACRLLQLSFIPRLDDEEQEGELNPSKDPARALTLFVARDRKGFDRLLWTVHSLIWGALCLLLVLVVLLVRLTLGGGLAPLDDISRQVQRINPRDLHTRILLEHQLEELDPVVHQLNTLLARLDEAVQRERRFTSDVAHELRTPLAELRSLAEVGVTDPDDRTAILGFLNDVREISLEMQHLVTGLLDLSRCDSGVCSVDLGPVSLKKVIDKTWKRSEATAYRRRVQAQLKLNEDLFVVSDSLMLERIVQNLLDNAVRYSPEGGTLEVCSFRKGGQVYLTLSNRAPALEEEDLARLFDRFWQKDCARTGGKNVGLGLSLVRCLVDLLEITVATELQDGVLTFTLQFPAGSKPV